MVIGKGLTDRYLTDIEVRELVEQSMASLAIEGKRVLMIIPDGTRTMPMPLMFRLFQELLAPQVKALDYLVALGRPSDERRAVEQAGASGPGAGRAGPHL
jgi:hypothetical protein